MKVKSLSPVWIFVTPCTVAYQAPPSMGFSRQEYWSGLPFPFSTLLYILIYFLLNRVYPKCTLWNAQDRMLPTQICCSFIERNFYLLFLSKLPMTTSCCHFQLPLWFLIPYLQTSPIYLVQCFIFEEKTFSYLMLNEIVSI